MVNEGSEPTGDSAGLSDKDRATMKDGMPKLTKTEQLQIMQDKADVIAMLQRELQKDIQDYKLGNLEDLLIGGPPHSSRQEFLCSSGNLPKRIGKEKHKITTIDPPIFDHASILPTSPQIFPLPILEF
jgi:hypothetical protein